MGKSAKKKQKHPTAHPGRWPLTAAKAHLSEIVRHAREDGPQILTSHGKDVAEIRTLDEQKPGRTLHDFFVISAKRGIGWELTLPERMPVTHREFSFDD